MTTNFIAVGKFEPADNVIQINEHFGIQYKLDGPEDTFEFLVKSLATLNDGFIENKRVNQTYPMSVVEMVGWMSKKSGDRERFLAFAVLALELTPIPTDCDRNAFVTEWFEDFIHEYNSDGDLEDTTLELLLPKVCGCGRPELAIKSVRKAMSRLGRYPGRQQILNWSDDYVGGLEAFLLYYLDAFDFTEHGGSVYGSWLETPGIIYALILELYAKLIWGE